MISADKQRIIILVVVFVLVLTGIAVIISQISPLPQEEENVTPEPERPQWPSGPLMVVASKTYDGEMSAPPDFVCDGLDDQEEIIAAFRALPPQGGTVVLMNGTFNCTGSINLPDNSTLMGQGSNATVLNFPSIGSVRVNSGKNICFSNFGVTGKGNVYISTSDVVVENVDVFNVDSSYMAAFIIYAANEVIENVRFINCRAVDVDRWGFVHSGEGTPNRVQDCVYINCQAINCGRYDQYYGVDHQYTEAWDVGFDIAESLRSADNITYINCYAEGCWESGFHAESHVSLTNIRLINCTSTDNAQKQKIGEEEVDFGAGFLVNEGMYLENCTSQNNTAGFHCSRADDSYLVNCRDIGSEKGFLILSIGQDGLHLRSCVTEDAAEPVYVWTGSTLNVTLSDMTILSQIPRSTAGITVDALVRNPDRIFIKDSVISGYQLGIDNLAKNRGLVQVANVSVTGSETNFINCNVIST
ncbi:hypothetical protein [uncultured Methanofollis sp.]|uniref:hypothetical protein n=1 Tax=uncultured Methanofollis sp. TaxID=262500 RepID=UPI002624078F|nr:hypothetical protein [uncultured Methanofollis sp.]